MYAARTSAAPTSVEVTHQQQATHAHLPVFDPVLDYEKLHRLGEGTYGVVYKGTTMCNVQARLSRNCLRMVAAGVPR